MAIIQSRLASVFTHNRITAPSARGKCSALHPSSLRLYLPTPYTLICAAENNDNPLSWVSDLGAAAEKLINTQDLENVANRLDVAEKRVQNARAALLELEVIEKEFQKKISEGQSLEEVDVAESAALAAVKQQEEDAIAAEEKLRQAAQVLLKAQSQLDSLSPDFSRKWEADDVDESAERVESVKAAAIAGVTAVIVNSPIYVAQGIDISSVSNLIGVAVTIATAVLFGVTYRYAVRRDLGNVHLKSGVVGAFTLARGLAQVDTTQQLVGLNSSWGQGEIFTAVGSAVEGGIMFAFVAVAIDYFVKEGLLSPFPSKQINF